MASEKSADYRRVQDTDEVSCTNDGVVPISLMVTCCSHTSPTPDCSRARHTRTDSNEPGSTEKASSGSIGHAGGPGDLFGKFVSRGFDSWNISGAFRDNMRVPLQSLLWASHIRRRYGGAIRYVDGQTGFEQL